MTDHPVEFSVFAFLPNLIRFVNLISITFLIEIINKIVNC